MKSKISNFQPCALILASFAASILIGPEVLQAVNKQDEVDKMDADAFSDRAELIRKEEERQTNALYPTR